MSKRQSNIKAFIQILCKCLLAVFLVVCGFQLLEETKGTGSLDEGRSQVYQSLITRQIASEWECIAQDKKESFIFSLMDRFAPNDKKLIESGRIWKGKLEEKAKSGSITVAERELLQSGYYYEDMDAETRIDVSIRNFRQPTCIDSCVLPIIKIEYIGRQDPENFQITYEDRFSQWQLTGRNLIRGMAEEYNELRNNWSIDEKIEKLNQYFVHQEQVKKEAEQTVLNMNAATVPEASKASAIKSKYLQLWCTGQRL